MTKRKFSLTESDLKRVKEAVQQAESKTSGEIVPYIALQSDDYGWVHLQWALMGWAVSTMVLWLCAHYSMWPLSVAEILFWQFAAMIVGFLVSLFPAVKRRTIPESWRADNVHKLCLTTFLRLGLVETRERSGVLIYFSLLERQVEILADKGITEKLSKEFWDAAVKKIVEGIHAGNAVDTLCQVIGELGQTLGQHFPRSKDDQNELSDDLRTE